VIGVLSPTRRPSPDPPRGGMVMSIYAAAYAIVRRSPSPATGALDRRSVVLIGHQRVHRGTIFCALAPNATLLLAGGALAALGAGMVTPVAAAIAAATSPPSQRGSGALLSSSWASAWRRPVAYRSGASSLHAGWPRRFWFVVRSRAGACRRGMAGSALRTPVNTLGRSRADARLTDTDAGNPRPQHPPWAPRGSLHYFAPS